MISYSIKRIIDAMSSDNRNSSINFERNALSLVMDTARLDTVIGDERKQSCIGSDCPAGQHRLRVDMLGAVPGHVNCSD